MMTMKNERIATLVPATRGARCRLLAGVALVAASLTGVGATQAATELKLTHSGDTSHPNHVAAVEMAENIEERTGGEIRITIFPANELGSPPETTEQVRLGVIELAILSPSQLDKFNRAFGVVFIPYQFDDYAHAHRTLDETALEWIRENAREAGFEHIANFEWGFRSLTNSRRPVNSPDDVRGLKLRVPPEIQIKAAMEALGAVTHTIAFPEVYTALATRTVDGQDNPVPTNYSSKFYEVQDHLALTKHVYTPMMLVANARAWDRLSDEQRAIITEEAHKAGAEARAEVQDKERWYIEEMEQAGVQTTYPDVAEFRELMDPAYEAIKEYVGEDNWDAWQDFVEAARAG
jgi:TRAP-type transport system periplasmic protein